MAQHPMMQPQVILLREGTDTSQGKGQVVSNINACVAVVDTVRTTLGPRGMDKLVHDDKGTTISNDGATIMKLLEIVHPAAKTLVDIAKSQDSEVGDGTTTVVMLAGALLKEAKAFIEEGVHPKNLISAFRQGSEIAVKQMDTLSHSIVDKGEEEKRNLLRKCAETTLTSKLVGGEREFFAGMVVDAVSSLDQDLLDINLIGIKKVQGGAMRDSFLCKGVAFKKTFSYAGFEQQPKKLATPKILCLNVELELKSERDNAEIRLSDPSQYQSIVDAEWDIIYDKLAKCVDSGANVVLSRLAIGDLGTQYFADRGLFCAGRVSEEDMQRVSKATGASVQSSTSGIPESALGTCDVLEERQIGSERFNLFTGCPHAKTATLVLRGGAEKFIDEAERSLHDAIQIVRRSLKNASIVPGGGAVDLEVSKAVRDKSRETAGKSQYFLNAYAKAMEAIPRQLCENAGFDATSILNKLRQMHSLSDGSGARYGVDVNTGGVTDTYEAFVWEPALVKQNALTAATEAANLILSVDETVRNPQSEGADQNAMAQQYGMQGAGAGRGRGGRGKGRGRGSRR